MCRRTCAPTLPPRARTTPQFYARAIPIVCNGSQRRRAGRGVGSPMRSESKSAQMAAPFLSPNKENLRTRFQFSLLSARSLGGNFWSIFGNMVRAPKNCLISAPKNGGGRKRFRRRWLRHRRRPPLAARVVGVPPAPIHPLEWC